MASGSFLSTTVIVLMSCPKPISRSKYFTKYSLIFSMYVAFIIYETRNLVRLIKDNIDDLNDNNDDDEFTVFWDNRIINLLIMMRIACFNFFNALGPNIFLFMYEVAHLFFKGIQSYEKRSIFKFDNFFTTKSTLSQFKYVRNPVKLLLHWV